MHILKTLGPGFPFTAGLYMFLVCQIVQTHDLHHFHFSYTHEIQLGEAHHITCMSDFAYNSWHYASCLLVDSIQKNNFLIAR